MTTDAESIVSGAVVRRGVMGEIAKRALRWLAFAAALLAVAATGFFTFTASPLILLYWDVGRLLPALTFSFQIAAVAVNLALFATMLALASAMSRLPFLRRRPAVQASGASLLLAVAIVVALVYLYPIARTGLLTAAVPGTSPPVSAFDGAVRA